MESVYQSSLLAKACIHTQRHIQIVMSVQKGPHHCVLANFLHDTALGALSTIAASNIMERRFKSLLGQSCAVNAFIPCAALWIVRAVRNAYAPRGRRSRLCV